MLSGFRRFLAYDFRFLRHVVREKAGHDVPCEPRSVSSGELVTYRIELWDFLTRNSSCSPLHGKWSSGVM
jgi:hypothetical protein